MIKFLRSGLLIGTGAIAALGAAQVQAAPLGPGDFDGSETLVDFDFGVGESMADLTGDGTASIANTGSGGSLTALNLGSSYFTATNIGTPSGDPVGFAGGASNQTGQITVTFDASLNVQKFALLISSDNGSGYADTDYSLEAFNGASSIGSLTGDIDSVTGDGTGEFVGLSTGLVITSVVIDWNLPIPVLTRHLIFDDLRYQAIPEPASLAMLGLGGLLILRRPARRR